MISKLCLMSVAALFAVAALAAAPTRPSDDSLRAIEQAIETEREACGAEKNIQRKMDCQRAVREKYQRSSKVRGTREYSEATYLALSTADLEKTRLQLMDQQDKARELRDFTSTQKRPPGELTKEMLGVELGVIEDELRRRGRARDGANLEKWKTLDQRPR